MSGELRVLSDVGGALAPIVDGLHDVAHALRNRQFAIVGGVAVLTHVQGHRTTRDIDSAVLGARADIVRELRVVAARGAHGREDAVLPNGVPVDLLVVNPRALRPGMGARREAMDGAVRWALESAKRRDIICDPPNPRGRVAVRVATAGALLAMKTISLTDSGRGEKSADDCLDLWLLLVSDPNRAAEDLASLALAPAPVSRWVHQTLRSLMHEDPGSFLARTQRSPTAPHSIAEIADVWEGIVQPNLPKIT